MELTDDQRRRVTLALATSAGTPLFDVVVEGLGALVGKSDTKSLSFKPLNGATKMLYLSTLLHWRKKSEKQWKAHRKLMAYCLMRLDVPVDEVGPKLGMSKEWTYRLVEEIHEKGQDAILPDNRVKNGKEPLYKKPEIVKFVAQAINGPPPNGDRWRAKDVASIMEYKFGFTTVPLSSAAEVFNRAKKVNQVAKKIIQKNSG